MLSPPSPSPFPYVITSHPSSFRSTRSFLSTSLARFPEKLSRHIRLLSYIKKRRYASALPRNNFTNRKRNVLFAIRRPPRPPPPPLLPDPVFQQPPGSRAGGAQIRELHCQAGMIYLTNISIQPRTRISNEARAKAERA